MNCLNFKLLQKGSRLISLSSSIESVGQTGNLIALMICILESTRNYSIIYKYLLNLAHCKIFNYISSNSFKATLATSKACHFFVVFFPIFFHSLHADELVMSRKSKRTPILVEDNAGCELFNLINRRRSSGKNNIK